MIKAVVHGIECLDIHFFFYHRKQTQSMVLEHNSSFLQRSNLNQSSLKCQYYAFICVAV